jgi:hypothetical protein
VLPSSPVGPWRVVFDPVQSRDPQWDGYMPPELTLITSPPAADTGDTAETGTAAPGHDDCGCRHGAPSHLWWVCLVVVGARRRNR